MIRANFYCHSRGSGNPVPYQVLVFSKQGTQYKENFTKTLDSASSAE